MAPIAARRRSVVGSQATLALLQPHAAQKKPARLRFKSDRPSTQVGGVYKPAGRWPAGFWATSTRWIKTQTRAIFARRQIRNACNLPSRARIPMPSAALPSICGLQPAACRACGPRPQCPGHPQPPASVPSACSSQPQPQVPAALVLSPRCLWPSVSVPGVRRPQSQPQPQAPAASGPCDAPGRGTQCSVPGTFGFHATVRQSPTVCNTPHHLVHVVSHAVACDAS